MATTEELANKVLEAFKNRMLQTSFGRVRYAGMSTDVRRLPAHQRRVVQRLAEICAVNGFDPADYMEFAISRVSENRGRNGTQKVYPTLQELTQNYLVQAYCGEHDANEEILSFTTDISPEEYLESALEDYDTYIRQHPDERHLYDAMRTRFMFLNSIVCMIKSGGDLEVLRVRQDDIMTTLENIPGMNDYVAKTYGLDIITLLNSKNYTLYVQSQRN